MIHKLSDKQIKEGWQVVKFGEIAREVKLTSKKPDEDGLEFYVGLDHLDPQSLRIVRKGIISEDKPSFTRRFSKGQILFAKRRCYQKKAAVANFDGICSSDIIVIEAIPQKMIAGLLPFIIQSDAFFDWAERTSSGSLSPRTKWKSLAEFKFPLPPVERQKEILEVLEKVEACIYAALSANDKGKVFWNAFKQTHIIHNDISSYKKASGIFKLTSGKPKTKAKLNMFSKNNSVPVYGGNGLNGYTSKALVDEPVIVIGRVGEYCGSIHLVNKPTWITDNALYTTKISSSIDIKYLSIVLRVLNLNNYKSRSGQPLITQKNIGDLNIFVPNKKKQQEIVFVYNALSSTKERLSKQEKILYSIRQKAIKEITSY